MKKLLALAALAALTLTGCGGTGGKSDAPPALIQPADYEHDTPAAPAQPATQIRQLAEVADNRFFEVTGTNSSGKRFRCYITEGSQTVAQTCYEYGPAS